MSLLVCIHLAVGYSEYNRSVQTFVIKFAQFLFAFMIGLVSYSYRVEFDHFVFSNNTHDSLVSCNWQTLDLFNALP